MINDTVPGEDGKGVVADGTTTRMREMPFSSHNGHAARVGTVALWWVVKAMLTRRKGVCSGNTVSMRAPILRWQRYEN